MRLPLLLIAALLCASCCVLPTRAYTSQELITIGIWRSNMVNLNDPCLSWSNSRLNATVNKLFGFYATNAYIPGNPLASSGCYNVSYVCNGSVMLSDVLPVPNTWNLVNFFNPAVWGSVIPMSVLANPSQPTTTGCQLDLTYYPPKAISSFLCTSACASQYHPNGGGSRRSEVPEQADRKDEDRVGASSPSFPSRPPKAAKVQPWLQNTVMGAAECSDTWTNNFFKGDKNKIAECFNGHTWQDDVGYYLDN